MPTPSSGRCASGIAAVCRDSSTSFRIFFLSTRGRDKAKRLFRFKINYGHLIIGPNLDGRKTCEENGSIIADDFADAADHYIGTHTAA